MPRKQGKNSTPVTSHKHKRANIPTEELREFVAEDERKPKTVLYPRDPSLDPQLVWKGKDEQVQQPLAGGRRILCSSPPTDDGAASRLGTKASLAKGLDEDVSMNEYRASRAGATFLAGLPCQNPRQARVGAIRISSQPNSAGLQQSFGIEVAAAAGGVNMAKIF